MIKARVFGDVVQSIHVYVDACELERFDIWPAPARKERRELLLIEVALGEVHHVDVGLGYGISKWVEGVIEKLTVVKLQ